MGGVSPARGFMAEHDHYDADAGFWESHADRLGGPVVDLGTAAGRIAIPLAVRGHDVWAVDSDPEMLEVLIERAGAAGVRDRITPQLADIAEAPLPRNAGLVMIAMNTLQVLREPEEQVACLARAGRCLAPGGEVIFDVAVPAFDDIEANIGAVIPTGVHRDPLTGAVLTHTAVYDSFDPITHTLGFRIIIDRDGGGSGGREERVHAIHLFTAPEITHLAARAGLHILSAHGGFRGEPLLPDSERQVYRLAPPS